MPPLTGADDGGGFGAGGRGAGGAVAVGDGDAGARAGAVDSARETSCSLGRVTAGLADSV
ncbi:MAG: hypothetical protein HC889_05350 [Synechococcaceae cyanobacterium SM1_2_3]|nr:hypothetical protein [Synechococcaceae cyanobacterium SM1_2_3]